MNEALTIQYIGEPGSYSDRGHVLPTLDDPQLIRDPLSETDFRLYKMALAMYGHICPCDVLRQLEDFKNRYYNGGLDERRRAVDSMYSAWHGLVIQHGQETTTPLEAITIYEEGLRPQFGNIGEIFIARQEVK